MQAFHPDAPKVGFQGPPGKECIRFTSTLNLSFPDADMSDISYEEVKVELPPIVPSEDDEDYYDQPLETEPETLDPRFRLAATFLGLYGNDSPIPTSYTEELIDTENSHLVRGFYDIFQHRLHSLFYRVWERYRYSIRFKADADDYYSVRLQHLLHLSPALRPPGAHISPARMLSFAGALGQSPRSASALRGALRAQFPAVRVDVEEFIARWLPIPEDQQFRLALNNTTLGVDAHLGKEILDRNCTYRVRVEPRDLKEFIGFLPGGDNIGALRELTDLFTTDFLDYEVEVCLHEDAVPELRLSWGSALLGWSTWLGTPPPEERRIRILFQGALHG